VELSKGQLFKALTHCIDFLMQSIILLILLAHGLHRKGEWNEAFSTRYLATPTGFLTNLTLLTSSEISQYYCSQQNKLS